MPYISATILTEVQKEVPVDAFCDRCGKEVPLLYEEKANLDGGSILVMEGMYGGYFDNVDGNYEAVLCHDCSHFMFNEMFKGIDGVLEDPCGCRSDLQDEE
jgi:hypothetical protein